jgi:hypothetical protein
MNAKLKTIRRTGVVWWNVIFGLWIALSPFVMAFRSPALKWSNVAVGAAVILLAFFHPGPLKALPVVLGAWIYASTFIFGFFRLPVLWSNLLFAVLVIAGAAASEARLPDDTA